MKSKRHVALEIKGESLGGSTLGWLRKAFIMRRSEWVGGSSHGEFWFQEANGKTLIWGLKLYGRRAGIAGGGGQVVRSHCKEALFYYGEECEFYFKFCKKSSERFEQKNDVWLSFKRPLWLQHKEWIMGLWRLWWVGPEAGRPVKKFL